MKKRLAKVMAMPSNHKIPAGAVCPAKNISRIDIVMVCQHKDGKQKCSKHRTSRSSRESCRENALQPIRNSPGRRGGRWFAKLGCQVVPLAYTFSTMRSFLAFLLGLIIGAGVVLFVPGIHREPMNSEVRQQLEALQGQLRQLGEQLKNVNLPKPGESSPAKSQPTPHATPQ